MSLIVFVVALAGCSEHVDPVSIAGNKWLGYQPFYTAFEANRDDLGGEHLVNFSMQDSSETVLRLFGNGRIQGALLTLDEALTFQSQTGLNLCVAKILNYSEGADGMVIRQGLDLLEAPTVTIGFEPTTLGSYMFRRAIDSLQLDSSHLISRAGTPTQQLEAFEQGRLDGLITFEPYLSEAVKSGGELVFSSRDIPGEIIDVLVFRSDFWSQHGSHADSHLGELWTDGLERIQNPSDKELEALLQRTGLNAEELRLAYSGVHLLSHSESVDIIESDLEWLIDRMTPFLWETGMIDVGESPNLSGCG